MKNNKIEAHIDSAKDGIITGWAWIPDFPHERLFVQAIDNQGLRSAIGYASNLRDDLESHGTGDGCYGFSIVANMDTTEYIEFFHHSHGALLAPFEYACEKHNAIDSFLLTALSLGCKIEDYFVDMKIGNIALFGVNSLLGKVKRHIGDVNIAAIFSDCDRSFHSYKTFEEYETINARPIEVTELPVLLCMECNYHYEKILYDMGISFYRLSDLLLHSFFKRKFYTRFSEFTKKRPDVDFILAWHPTVNDLTRERSKHERLIYTNSVGDFESFWSEKSNVILDIAKNAYYHYGYDEKYVDMVMPHSIYSPDTLVHYVNSRRVTTGVPDNPDNMIYCFGDSVTRGAGVDDGSTYCSELQRILNEHPGDRVYGIMNCANYGAREYENLFPLLESLALKSGDIVIVMPVMDNLQYFRDHYPLFCDTLPYIDKPVNNGEIFIDISHYNKAGNARLAHALFDFLVNNNLLDKRKQAAATDAELPGTAVAVIAEKDSAPLDPMLKTWLEELQYYNSTAQNAGAIVMNCNPFTLGHRYLIEYAAQRVEHLYIFVVEEDKSFFSFADRFMLVKSGIEDIENVTIIPSGKFIISVSTFKDYFMKEEKADVIIDATEDVTIFGQFIAPRLNISIRFVGEEPLDNVTQQYNATMKLILPKFGVDVQIIPRKEANGEVISASRVRKLLKERNYEEIEKLVPQTTLEYLRLFEVE